MPAAMAARAMAAAAAARIKPPGIPSPIRLRLAAPMPAAMAVVTAEAAATDSASAVTMTEGTPIHLPLIRRSEAGDLDFGEPGSGRGSLLRGFSRAAISPLAGETGAPDRVAIVGATRGGYDNEPPPTRRRLARSPPPTSPARGEVDPRDRIEVSRHYMWKSCHAAQRNVDSRRRDTGAASTASAKSLQECSQSAGAIV